MHQVIQEQREAAAVGHVIVAQKRLSSLGFAGSCLLLCTYNTNTHASPCATPGSHRTYVNPVSQGCTEADQPLFKLLTG